MEDLPPLVQEEQPPVIVEESAPTSDVQVCWHSNLSRSEFLRTIHKTAKSLDAEEPPARPWTPSYSVTKQGSGSDVGTNEAPSASEDIASSVPEVTTNGTDQTVSFPATEEPSQEPKKVSSK